MKKQEKIFEVENITAKIKEAKALALAEYYQLTANQAVELRDKIKQAGGSLQVIKNTLLLRALKANNYPTDDLKIEGQNITLFCEKDEIAPLKVFKEFAKKTSLLPFKIGFLAGNVLSAEELNRLAAILPREQLQGKLVNLLANPTQRLASSLSWNLQKLVIALNEVKNKK